MKFFLFCLLIALSAGCRKGQPPAVEAAKADRDHGDEPGTIHLSEEQRNILDIGVGLVVERDLREELRVPGEIRPRTGGAAEITAPLAGRLAVDKPLATGSMVAKGDILAGIVPPTTAAADLPSLQLSEAESRYALAHARHDRERAERLLAAGAAPRRRLEEARLLEREVEARVQAAEIRLKQYEASRQAEGLETGVKRFLVRAPIDGVLTESLVPPGSNVDAGAPLFRVVDVTSVFAVAMLPESDLPKLRQLSSAEIEVPGGDAIPARRLVSIGRMVDPETRTVPVTYEVAARGQRLSINQSVFVRLQLARAGSAKAVLESAIVSDGASKVVYVQTRQDHFERRVVKPGMRSAGFVQIVEGLDRGERVVVRGAYLIRLAAAGGAIPAEGHIH